MNFEAGLSVVSGEEQLDGSYVLTLGQGGSVSVGRAIQQNWQLDGLTVSFDDFKTQCSGS
jgi:hypothetical protein